MTRWQEPSPSAPAPLRMSRRPDAGFTLVELTIALVLLALIASLL